MINLPIVFYIITFFLCYKTYYNANQLPFIHLFRCPSILIKEVTGSTLDRASGKYYKLNLYFFLE
jgi:hypothetical protein